MKGIMNIIFISLLISSIFIPGAWAQESDVYTELLKRGNISILAHKKNVNYTQSKFPAIFWMDLVFHIEKVFDHHLPLLLQQKMKQKSIKVLIEKNSSAEGVFYPPGTHELFKGNDLIISFDPSALSSLEFYRLVTHELFHAIHFVLKPQEESWVREGLAQLFENKIHQSYNLTNVMTALSVSTTSLLGSFDHMASDPEQYGHDFLFFYFLEQKCSQGNELFFWQLSSSLEQGKEGIESALKKSFSASRRSLCINFKSSANAFMVARALNKYSGMPQQGDTYILDTDSVMAPNGHLYPSQFKFQVGPSRPV